MTDDQTPGRRPPLPGELGPASLRSRALATIVDLALVLPTAAMTASLLGDAFAADVRAAVVVVLSAWPTLLTAVGTGRSVGKVVLRLDHVRPGDPPTAAPDPVTLGVRWGLKWLVPTAMVVLQPVPWTWALLWWLADGAPLLVGGRRALHDRIAGTRVWELVTRDP